MSDLIFHVYDKNDEVIAHTLSVDELEKLLESKIVNTSKHLVVPVEDQGYTDASY